LPALQADAAARMQAALGPEMGPQLGEQLALFGPEPLSESLSGGGLMAFPDVADGADRA
jgi:hypothetical protein